MRVKSSNFVLVKFFLLPIVFLVGFFVYSNKARAENYDFSTTLSNVTFNVTQGGSAPCTDEYFGGWPTANTMGVTNLTSGGDGNIFNPVLVEVVYGSSQWSWDTRVSNTGAYSFVDTDNSTQYSQICTDISTFSPGTYYDQIVYTMYRPYPNDVTPAGHKTVYITINVSPATGTIQGIKVDQSQNYFNAAGAVSISGPSSGSSASNPFYFYSSPIGFYTISGTPMAGYTVYYNYSINGGTSWACGTYCLGSSFTYNLTANQTLDVRFMYVPIAPSGDIKCKLGGSGNTPGDSCTIMAGQSADLSWTSTYATSCTITGNSQSFSGTNSSANTGALSAGTYTYTQNCTGPGGTLNVDSVTITVNPNPDFSLWHSPVSQTTTQGSAVSYTVSVSPLNSNNSTVTLSVSGCPTNATCSFPSGNSIPWSSGSQTLQVSTTASTPAGSYTLTVIATDGTNTHYTYPQLVVNALPPTVTLTASPGAIVQGNASNLSWTISGSVTSCSSAGADVLPAGSWSSAVSGGPASTGVLNTVKTYSYALSCTGPGGTTSASASVVVSAAPPSGDIQCKLGGSANPYTQSCVISANQSIDLNWVSFYTTSCQVNPGGWTGTNSSANTGALSAGTYTYILNCTGPGGSGNVDSVTITVNPNPDFNLTSSPSSQSVTQGSSVSYTVSVSPLNGFNSAVTLSVSGCPTNATCSFPSGNTIAGGNGSQTLQVSTAASTPAGSYTLTVTGTGGSITHTTSPQVVVNALPPTVTLSASPSTIIQGNASTLTWTVANATSCSSTGVNSMPAGTWSSGASGSASTGVLNTVQTYSYGLFCTGPGGTASASASVVVNPAPPAGDIKCKLGGSANTPSDSCSITTGQSIDLSWTSTYSTSCTITGNSQSFSGTSSLGTNTGNFSLVGTYTYTQSCTGPGGTLNVDTVVITVTAAPDFTISSSGNQSVTQGSAVAFTITVSPLNGFNSTVTLSVSGCPTNATCSFPSGNTIAGGNGSQALLVSTTASVSAGNYTLVITGTSGALNHSTSPQLTVNALPPTVTLSASPTTVTQGNSSTLSWTISGSVTSCSSAGADVLPSGSWSSSVSGSASTGALNTIKTYGYSLSCTGPGGTTLASASVTVNPNAPVVDLKCNGADSATVDYLGSCDLTWTTTNSPTSCTASVDWSGAKTTAASNGPETQSNLTSSKTYTIVCANVSGSGAPDTVLVTVRPQGPASGSGSSTACGQITLTWNSVLGVDGYYVYRNTINTFPGVGGRITTINSAATTTYTDAVLSGTYYYWITSFKSGVESNPPTALNNNPLGPTVCDASIGSDLDITKVNNAAPSGYNPGNDGLSQTPPSVVYRLSDILSFSLNLNQNATIVGAEDAKNIVIKDRLINLIKPGAGWNLKVGGSTWTEQTTMNCTNDTTAAASLSASQYGVCGSAPNQTVYIKVPDMAKGSTTSVTYDAQVSVPLNFKQTSSRFQNNATVTYDKNSTGVQGTATVATPLVLFNLSSVPEKGESAN